MEMFHLSTCQKSGEEAVQAVTQALADRKFSVLWDLDINAKLAEKGIDPEPFFHILEVCSAPRAKQALTINQQAGYFLPCKIVVYESRDTHETTIGLVDPSVFLTMLDDAALTELGVEVGALLSAAVDEACR
jgi:uncharacterized protein (DUF302 family)